MEKKNNKKYYIIPAIYLLVIILLVSRHFGANNQFLENHLNIILTGTTKSANKSHAENVLSLDVIISSIKFSFSDSMPLQIESNNGIISNFYIIGYQKNDNGVDLFFTDDFKINIAQTDTENGFTISPQTIAFDNTNGGIKKIAISFDIDRSKTLFPSSIFPVFGYTNDGAIYFLTAGGNYSTIDIRQKEIALLPDSNNNFAITISKAKEGLKDPNTFWLAKNKPDILQRDIEEDIAEQLFADNAFRGWRIDRLNRTEGRWLDKNRQLVYSREILSALGSEVVRRRAVAINQWIVRLAERNNDIRYLETALVNGNLFLAHLQSQERNIAFVQEITSRIRRNDPSVFLIDDLVKTIVNNGPFSLAQELFLMAERFDIKSLDVKMAIGVASAYLDFVFINIESETSLKRFNTIVDTIILNRLVINEDGLFLTIAEDRSESFYTAKVATLFRKAAKITERPILERIGSRLVHSIILLMDETGFLPEYIYVDERGIKRTEGRLEPEYIYPALSIARYMPSIRPLIDYFSPGAWIATCADSINIIKPDDTRVTIETTFPIGETEYIVVQGIPLVSRMLLHGINWSPSLGFEGQATGWTYNSETQTLFIKLQHRQEKETIEIFF
ncbi:MAG: hypothetical protein FWD87_07350 [Spirochaetaceae bacterium]|nr:hypothetical protein [Spirochaetaceae bacterium]